MMHDREIVCDDSDPAEQEFALFCALAIWAPIGVLTWLGVWFLFAWLF